MDEKPTNILTVDLEYFQQAEYVQQKLTKSGEVYACGEKLFLQSFRHLMEILKTFQAKATFFIVGEIANEFPCVVKEIHSQGHEVAFHGFQHKQLWKQSRDSFRSDLNRFDFIVRSMIKERCIGFRAPSFSMDNSTLWAFDLLEGYRYAYDSSVFPVWTPLYGSCRAPIVPFHPSHYDIAQPDKSNSRKLIEFPLLILEIAGLRVPAAGGFYSRLLPCWIIKKAINRMNSRGYPAVLFFHTWEIDPIFPRLKLDPIKSFITYYNLENTEKKLRNLLSAFDFTSFKLSLENNELSL